MPLSSLSSAILSHMLSISNVPHPQLRSIPSLKVSKTIDYGQLNILCHMRGLQYYRKSSVLSVHDAFMKQYPKVFLKKKRVLPSLSKEEDERHATTDKKEESQPKQPGDESHNIAVHIKKVHGGYTLYGQKTMEEKIVEFLAILKKMPVHRTRREHVFVWKMLKTIPELTSQLNDEYLKTLSENLFSETWIKGSTVDANDGLYVILKGQARLKIQRGKKVTEEGKLTTSSPQPENVHSHIFSEDFENSTISESDPILKMWSTFGVLEVTDQGESETKYSAITEEDCEIIKFSSANYTKIKLERSNLELKQKIKLIHKCPYYETWPTLSIYELVTLIKWKKFPADQVIVESGNIISFVAFIKSGYCKVYRNIIGLVKAQSKIKKIQKSVYMGDLKENESFGEISILLQVPLTCTIIAGNDVEMAIIEEKDLNKLEPVTRQLMLQTAKRTYGHLKDEDVKNEYLRKEKQKEWKNFKI
ncbi:cyclic nucleotide-binding domain-containing protein 1 isoform X2 [Erinaceus europaeus]|uniref:Cyclic nucleotide-binding domain-containing protein 1 isoform X2 n=1 Tax=Erinaceus europaeus TaxID=9365 RepID=A0ABM3Y2G0_ERIEU|nr:cyclic nucleotide-binding domain-containing protein 1 isoform X2 [Erinaceus europaeus]